MPALPLQRLQLRQRLLIRVGVNQRVAGRQRHLFELRHAGLRRLDINGRHIRSVVDRQRQNLPAQHLRALLVHNDRSFEITGF